VKRIRQFSVVAGAALAMVTLAGTMSPAAAAPADGPSTTPSQNGSRAGVTMRNLRISGDASSTPNTTVWEAPPCWRAPDLTGPQYAEELRGNHRRSGGRDGSTRLPSDVAEHENEEGFWWGPVSNGTAAGARCAAAMNPFYVWVGESDPAPPNGVTPEILAQIARAYLDLPAPDVKVNPGPPRRSYVGMGTWVWADPVDQQLSATAELPDLNMSATVVATRRNLVIDPGTADTGRYRTHPCTGLGKPYPANASRRVAEQDPPCGVTYLRASSDQPNRQYTLTAELTWGVTWQGSGGTGGTMADTTLGDSVQVPVGEVQTTVRD
jgi:enoyl reductase